MEEKRERLAWCEVIPEDLLSPGECKRILEGAMEFADPATKKDIQKAIERLETRQGPLAVRR